MTHLAERWPAALPLHMAAEYCSLSVDTFKEVCPVKPVQFTQSTRGDRYLRTRLDAWLESVDPNGPSFPMPRRRIGERIGGG
ncbi:hypothetical protein SAMN05443247_03694 [Bradyrhizobium erythrophlei]|nr:hypothetical protein SAMN05443247_03694 [Bradyrhizobium erythrophlei]